MERQKIVWLNHKKCTGCNLCRLVCSFAKTGKFSPEDSRISISERDRTGFVQMICRNCEDAPCMEACPAGALTKRKEDNYVLLKQELCVGCNMCVMVCPFNAIGQAEHSNYKCDTCDGKERCAKICEHDAIEFIDYSKAAKQKRRQAIQRARVK